MSGPGYYYHTCKLCRNIQRREKRSRSEEEAMYSRARSRAKAALARMHPQDFEVLMARELDVEHQKLWG